ncbi:MAG TPA: Zn-dependent hydrolase [Bacteroidales bacterium]|nr:Zn-dependent hydrolase [Bacteroidales bacterium]
MIKNCMYGAMFATLLLVAACQGGIKETTQTPSPMEEKLAKYVKVPLTTNLSVLTAEERQMLPLLFDAAAIMDELFWLQAFGDKHSLLDTISDTAALQFAMINYGPWDRLDGQKPFLGGYGEKPKGANFYPADMTKEEFDAFEDPNKNSQYTLIRRDDQGKLISVWYHEAYAEQLQKAANLVSMASDLAMDKGLFNYLTLRAQSLLTSDYRSSDMAWLDMKDNTIDFVVGPIENYEDALYNNKAAFEAFILIKDKEWSSKLDRYTAFLPDFQKNLPVEPAYKNETPGTSGNQLNVYDVVYYAGDCNAGSKTIAINLPNDEVVREQKGSRKLQLKNAMQAKFDKILVPIANELIDESQRQHITFDAFFANTMFHEVAHGLGLSYLSKDKKVTVREALQDSYTSIEEGKADILGLYIVNQLYEKGELGEVDIRDYYTTFMASIFRSVRFGVSSAHGKANMMRFYFFQERGAFVRNAETGTYKIDYDKMKEAMNELTTLILTIQGDGDYQKATEWIARDGAIKAELQGDLDRLSGKNIPVDVVFEQGRQVLGI